MFSKVVTSFLVFSLCIFGNFDGESYVEQDRNNNI